MACAIALAACGQAREIANRVGVASCTRCHGGDADSTGAPPLDLLARSDTGLPSVGAHATHVRALSGTAACKHCHPDPRAGSTAHMNGRVDVVFGTFATAGGALASRFDPDTLTCSAVYCHGAFGGGNAGNAPLWTSVGTGQAACGTCHGVPPPAPHPTVTGTGTAACNQCHAATVDATGSIIPPSAGGKHLDGVVTGGHPSNWMDTTSAGFHAYSADQNISTCESCHGAKLDGGTANLACANCHMAGGSASDFSTCTACHGGVDNQTGAPPAAIWGYAGDPSRGGGTLDAVRVGAHTSHLSAKHELANPVACASCHVVPADMFATGHLDGSTATVTFSGLASQGATPAWSRASATCTATYCHGGTLYGGTLTNPVWTTTDGSQIACGTCHGAPPPTGQHGNSHLFDCGTCHPGYTWSSVNAATHVDGVKQLGNYITGWNASTLTCSNNCHGILQW